MKKINKFKLNCRQQHRHQPQLQRLALGFIILLLGLLTLPGCNSNAGGSTGGNPLQSSLPLQISADAQ